MKNARDMFYSNYQAGGMQDPNIIYTPPQGYNISSQYQAYGPNIMNNQSNMPYNNNYNNSYSANEYDERITKLERQIRRLDERLRKLESGSIEENITDSNLYMI